MRKEDVGNVYYLPSRESDFDHELAYLDQFGKEILNLLVRAEEHEWQCTSYFLEKALESLFKNDA